MSPATEFNEISEEKQQQQHPTITIVVVINSLNSKKNREIPSPQ
jgi:hypothetical protein